MDVKIDIVGNIEDVNSSDISIKSATRYNYEFLPRPSIASMKGLVLIEVVLFNVEKFLQDNTKRTLSD